MCVGVWLCGCVGVGVWVCVCGCVGVGGQGPLETPEPDDGEDAPGY